MSVYLLLTYRENQSLLPLFFIVGGLTSFFDLLTAPLITLGILLIVSILLDKKQRAFLNSLSWYIGYLLLWFSKLLIAHLSYSPGALQSAVAQLANRAVGVADEKFSLFNTVTLNVSQLIGYDRFNKIVVLSCGILFLLVLLRYFSFKTKRIKSILPWVFVGVLPYLWFLTLANHSYIHVWYTYRNQFMSVAAFFLIVAEFIDWIKVKKEVGFLKTKLKSLSSPLK